MVLAAGQRFLGVVQTCSFFQPHVVCTFRRLTMKSSVVSGMYPVRTHPDPSLHLDEGARPYHYCPIKCPRAPHVRSPPSSSPFR